MLLLDTNVVSELRKSGTKKIDKHVEQWAKNIPAKNLFISVITLLEIEIGVLQVERRDLTQGKVLRTWLVDHVMRAFQDRIISIDVAITQACAKLHVPDPCSDRDALIAATAQVHSLTVVTRNTQDFKKTGIPLINPWEKKT